jgi:hypothetical protein
MEAAEPYAFATNTVRIAPRQEFSDLNPFIQRLDKNVNPTVGLFGDIRRTSWEDVTLFRVLSTKGGRIIKNGIYSENPFLAKRSLNRIAIPA